MTTSWQGGRINFNHDWLRNSYLPALQKWLNIIDGEIEDIEFSSKFPRTKMRSWEQHLQDAVKLASTFEEEMSPARICDEMISAFPSDDCLIALRDLTHGLWLVRNEVKERVGQVEQLLCKANLKYAALRLEVDNDLNLTDVVDQFRLRCAVEEFQVACCEVATAISEFPGEIRVI